MYLTCPFCDASISLSEVDPNAPVALCRSCTKVFRITAPMRKVLRGEVTAEDISIAYPDDYAKAARPILASDVEEAYLQDANPFSVDPYLYDEPRDSKYRAEITVEAGCLVIRTVSPGFFPFGRFIRHFLGTFLLLLGSLGFLVFSSFVWGDFPYMIGFFIAVFSFSLLIGMSNAYFWTINAQWQMIFSDCLLLYECRRGKERMELSIPTVSLKIMEAKRRQVSNEEWFAPARIRIAGGSHIVFFPCAGDEECRWLLREIDKYSRFTVKVGGDGTPEMPR